MASDSLAPRIGCGSRCDAPRGFTAIELMIVLVVVAILAAVAFPAMAALISASKLRGASSDLYSDLLDARSEAVKRHTNVLVTPVGGSWTGGWTVTFGGVALTKHEALPSDLRVQVNVPATSASTITFAANARVSSGAQTVIFYATAGAGVQARCVSTDPSGLAHITIDNNGNPADGCN